MQLKDRLPVIGWGVTFVLGIISGGFIVPRLTVKKKIIDWAVLSESDLIPKELSQTLGITVVVHVGSEQPSSLSTVHVRLGSGGNDVIEKAKANVVVSFNTGSNILNVRPLKDLGECRKYVRWSPAGNSCPTRVYVKRIAVRRDRHSESILRRMNRSE